MDLDPELRYPWAVMKPFVELDHERISGQRRLALFQRGDDFYIQIDGEELMSSRRHGSEEDLARLALAELGPGARAPRVLVGGLGLGYTARAALDRLPPDGALTVAEVYSSVVRWNRERLGHLAGYPLRDPRATVVEADVAELLRPRAFDAILLDVDNGPDALTRPENERLYDDAGLARIRRCLGRGGVLGLWSAAGDERFLRRLRGAGFDARCETVRARRAGKGSRYTIFLARPGAPGTRRRRRR